MYDAAMKPKYKPLPGNEKPQATFSKCPTWCKLTRFKIIGLIVIFLTAIVFLLVRCFNTSMVQGRLFCCTQNPILAPAGNLYKETLDKTLGDYDETLEGSNNLHYKHTRRHLPQCLVIGVRKGGTRALLTFLNLHPLVVTAPNEMHFFDDEDNYSLGLDWYRKHMPFSFEDQITIEKTPAYFYFDYVPERVYAMNSSIKLLVVVRDPTERAISDYTQIHATKVLKNKPHETFEELVIDEDTNDIRRSYTAVRRSIYHRQLEQWLEYFPLKQFHFVSGENLVNNPYKEMYKVEEFLNLPHRIQKDNFFFNKSRGFYCLQMADRQKCLAESKGRKHPDVDPDVIDKLHEYFDNHNKKFYRMVGRNFGWP
ncbi:unnamed protein product [Owenia fusiformis]|uniref:Heparan sulfate glucosamine 3-O-sulfotransferase 5 n=1 Tax=Owenia fusiformis TaxID=6347 RepID=A0A8S4MW13_OWEFU|nr:unnamed protein product [Owenia fusiformis]